MTKVLLVDDNQQNLYLLDSLLRSNGYQTATAANGAEALQSARGDLPDIVITDILMPVMDGFSLCREWKRDEKLKQCPFVFYTATYTDEKDKQFALGLGADRFVVKPTEPSDFLSIVRQVVKDRESGKLRAGTPTVPDESEQLVQYNQVLIRKLEEKMQELEEANRTLEQRVASRTRELEEMNAALQSFNSRAAHDLRAPLRAIAGFGDLLDTQSGTALDQQSRRHLTQMLNATAQMQRMLGDLLRYSELQRGQLSFTPIQLDEIFARIQRDTAEQVSETGAQLLIAENLPAVAGESTLVYGVFINLVQNGLKYRRQGVAPIVQVTADIENNAVVVSIRDNGIGIDRDNHGRVFEPFERLHGSETYPGTGIGLAIVRKSVSLLRGDVWLESTPDEGSTFFVRLALADDG